MTILEAIEAANEETGIRTLSFAQLQEFNSFLDSFTFEEYPIHVMVPFTISGNLIQEERTVKQTLALSGWVLTRISEDTNDFRSRQVEIDYTAPMRLLAKKFLISLRSQDIVDPEVSSIPYTIRPEYQLFHAHLFGCSYTINLPIISRVC